ncbi:MAG: hypothetical protein RIB98_03835 [Acidimicrobiales bacterium]
MTDLPASPFDDLTASATVLDGLVEVVREQAEEIAALDAGRAEAWASDVLALAAETDHQQALVAALASADDEQAATTLTALRGLLDDVPSPRWTGEPPAWADAIGTSRCEGAWALTIGGASSIAFRFVDADDERHVITVDVVPGPPETIGEVMVGPGDLLTVLHEDDAGIDSEVGGPTQLAARVIAALTATERPPESAVVNGRLLLRRMGLLVDVGDIAPPVFVAEDLPEKPERDPQDDAYALGVLVRALGPAQAQAQAEAEAGAAADAVIEVAAMAAPTDLGPLSPAERDAVLTLEWADWLGAVIGLVRRGPGATVDGAALVDCINRCPEVDTTIPKGDRARIEWAFDVVIAPWDELGITEDGTLTPLGIEALPAALHRAWG